MGAVGGGDPKMEGSKQCPLLGWAIDGACLGHRAMHRCLAVCTSMGVAV